MTSYVPSKASSEEQRVYWVTSCVFLWIGAAGVVYIMKDMRKNPLYKRAAFKGFIPLMFGDLAWVCVYLPFHTYTAIGSTNNKDFDIDTNENKKICAASMFGMAFAIVANLFGLMVVAYSVHQTVSHSLQLRILDENRSVVTCTFLSIGYVGCFLLSTLLIGIDYDRIGSYRGLYCAWISWGRNSFVYILLVCVVGVMSLSSYYFVKTYFLIKAHATRVKKSNNVSSYGSENGSINDAMTKAVIWLAIRFAVVFILAWSPKLVTTMISLFEVDIPVKVDMFSGLLLKVRVIIDVCVVLSLPGYRTTASAQRNLTETPNNKCHQDGAYTTTSATVGHSDGQIPEI